jgi:hypothetical protein
MPYAKLARDRLACISIQRLRLASAAHFIDGLFVPGQYQILLKVFRQWPRRFQIINAYSVCQPIGKTLAVR